MKLAIPYEEGQIFQHFGKTPAFKIYDIANGQVGGSMVFPTGGQGHGALAGLLRALGIGAVVCGGIGPGAIDALSQLNILPLPGVTGSADQAMELVTLTTRPWAWVPPGLCIVGTALALLLVGEGLRKAPGRRRPERPECPRPRW